MSKSLVFTPMRGHICSMPQVERTMTPPKLYSDDPDQAPVAFLDMPPVDSVWKCPTCGATWKVYASPYTNVLTNEWRRCTGWTYRRAVRRATKENR